MNAFNSNFKNMILIVIKSGLQESDCPVNEMLMGKLIDIMFNVTNSTTLLCKFKENVSKIDEKLKSKPSSSDASFLTALKNRNKSIFEYIDLFPDWIQNQHGDEIKWFSTFIKSRISEKHMGHIWKYLDKIYEQSLKLKA